MATVLRAERANFVSLRARSASTLAPALARSDLVEDALGVPFSPAREESTVEVRVVAEVVRPVGVSVLSGRVA